MCQGILPDHKIEPKYRDPIDDDIHYVEQPVRYVERDYTRDMFQLFHRVMMRGIHFRLHPNWPLLPDLPGNSETEIVRRIQSLAPSGAFRPPPPQAQNTPVNEVPVPEPEHNIILRAMIRGINNNNLRILIRREDARRAAAAAEATTAIVANAAAVEASMTTVSTDIGNDDVDVAPVQL